MLIRNLQSNRCHLWASALTYYSLFALVPMIALGVGIAKGFGLDDKLREYVMVQLSNNPEVARYLLEFSDKMLEHAEYGVVAGIGVFLLFFAVLKMIGNIEKAFNFIYGVRNNRPFWLKVSYYLSVLLICPVLLIAAGSATALFNNTVTALVSQYGLYPLSQFGAKFIPFPIVWLLLTVIYKCLPNTKVKFTAALTGAVVAGTLYQFLQMGFMSLQFALSRYNTVYGSFSALPLFMIYLQFSWLIVLFGIQISFVCQNIDNIDAEPGGTRLSGKCRRILYLSFAALSLRRLLDHGEPPTAEEFGRIFHLPSRMVLETLTVLSQSRVLIGALVAEHTHGYVPLLPPEEMTAANVIKKCEGVSHGEPPELAGNAEKEIEAILEKLSKAFDESNLNIRLDTISF